MRWWESEQLVCLCPHFGVKMSINNFLCNYRLHNHDTFKIQVTVYRKCDFCDFNGFLLSLYFMHVNECNKYETQA